MTTLMSSRSCHQFCLSIYLFIYFHTSVTGEATNRRHPASVSGAFESGIREADLIAALYGACTSPPPISINPEASSSVDKMKSRGRNSSDTNKLRNYAES